MIASILLQFTPLRSDSVAEKKALGQAVGHQLRAYRAGLPLLAPVPAGQPLREIAMQYKVWGMQYGQRANSVLTSHDAIAELFLRDGVDGRLLILGEPGMGKTHTLLALGERLLQRASRGGGPMPVLVDLSAWAGEPLAQWLEGYLWEEYRLCQPTAYQWIQTAALTLLLDGFDHLPRDRQRTCAKELDTLLRTNPDQTAILCCRRRVIEASGINFSYFNSGVHLVPLAATQVKDYALAQSGPDLWQSIKASKALQQLARFPLYLTMLAVLAAQGNLATAPITGRESLIQRYLAAQSGDSPAAGEPEARQWLAHHLAQRSRTFRLDRLQCTDLPSSQRLGYRGLVGLCFVLIFGILGGNWGLGLAVGLVFSQLDLETFPYTRLSLAIAPWRGVGLLVLVCGLPSLVAGLALGGFAALVLGRFNLGLPAFGWAGLIGAVLGWLLGLGLSLWGGLPQAIQYRRTLNQDVQMAFRNTLILLAVLGGILALVLVAPAVASGQPPLSLLSMDRLRVILASLVGALLWFSFVLQQGVVRLLLAVGRGSRWPWRCQPLLQRWVKQRLLRQVGGGVIWSHDELRAVL